MKFMQDLREIAEKNEDKEIVVNIKNGNTDFNVMLPYNYYIVEETVIFLFPDNIEDLKNEKMLTGKDFIEIMEDEVTCDCECWGTIYTAPMDDLGRCKLGVGYLADETKNAIFDGLKDKEQEFDDYKYFEIADITETENEIVITLE